MTIAPVEAAPAAPPRVALVGCTSAAAGAPILANPTAGPAVACRPDGPLRSAAPIPSPWSCHGTTARTTG